MAILLGPNITRRCQFGSSLSGCAVLPSVARFPARQACVAATAQGNPNYKLDQPNRLWEGGETWYPGADPPPYLDGSLPGDRGFDPFRLGENTEFLPWLVEGELYNGRWAMMGVLGMLFVEAVGLGPWGSAPFRVNWYLPYIPLVVTGHIIYITIEYYRWVAFQKKGETGILSFAPFDPLGLTNDYRRQSEVRNGRLAMLACLGFWSQAAVTRKGPIQNLQDHLADPGHNNICTSAVGKEFAVAVILGAMIPYYLETRKDIARQELLQEPFRPFPFISPDDY